MLNNLPEPIDLDVDENPNTLHWTDRGEHAQGTRPAAEHSNPVTSLRHEILVQNFDEPIGLAFDSDSGQ